MIDSGAHCLAPTLEDLAARRFAPATLEAFRARIRNPYGIFLVTGPTGSGKTTTLYGALDKINSADRKILTVEDPVEYELAGIAQVPVNEKVGVTFATALRALLRQDPDIMLVGEIRDQETADIATHAALTGHLVLSTLHTNDAAGAVTRLVDLGVAPYLVTSTVEAVLAQRLVRVLCANCRQPMEPAPEHRALLDWASPESPLPRHGEGDRGRGLATGEIHQPVGCEHCRGTGFRGRTGIYELFVLTEEVRSLILRRASSREIRRHAIERLLQQKVVNAVALAAPSKGALAAWIRRVGFQGLERAYSQDEEFEADELGVLLMRAAGFNQAGRS